jgi:hypothetical protein
MPLIREKEIMIRFPRRPLLGNSVDEGFSGRCPLLRGGVYLFL